MQFYPSGTRIARRYEVVGRPLKGGMGIVYLGFDHQEKRPVALKTFKPEYLPNLAARIASCKKAKPGCGSESTRTSCTVTRFSTRNMSRKSTWCWNWWRRREAAATPPCAHG